MSKAMIIDQFIQQHNGYLVVSDAINIGVSKACIFDYIKKNNMEKVHNGIYIKDDLFTDDLFVLQTVNRRVVFNGETALYLYGLMEREPEKMNVMVYSGYNAKHLYNQDVNVSYCDKIIYETGIEQVRTMYGNLVSVYDKEKTICEMIKNKKKYDIQVFSYAIKEYSKQDKDLGKLMRYAKLLKVENKVRTYMEILI